MEQIERKELYPGWYILLYHDISWEENAFLRSIGGTCPPDVFRRHVKFVAGLGELVSIQEGQRRLREETIDKPLFSLWFDDGLTGVIKNALPVLEQAGTTSAVSICSCFVNRSEFFWRFKLSYLNSIDVMRFLRSRLKKHGFEPGNSVRTFTLDHFSLDLAGYIDELYTRFTTPHQRQHAYRMFMDSHAVKTLMNHGWVIANHTARHYPISLEHSLHLLGAEFNECEAAIQLVCQSPSQYWVIPFDRKSSPKTVAIADSVRGDRYIVWVRDKVNTPGLCNAERMLYRIVAPIGSVQRLMDKLVSVG
jgi:peptidoglycan/xylan/chitin deacetylase (PgdA/CDA1 family)